MMSNKMAIDWHEKNLSEFRVSDNGNRNTNLNTLALKSFNLALGCDELSTAKVESDYESAAKSLQMDDSSVKATLRSASSAATPHEFYDDNSGNSPAQEKMTKENLALAPTYTALEDYAQAHGVPVKPFDDAKWTEGVYPYGKYKGAACFLVPHEDSIVRARIKNPEETDDKKWLPIKPSDMKEKITPCWYGFKGAVTMASKAAHKTIVLCNGQPSTVTAQHYGIPALAQTDGENKFITTPLLKRLLTAIKEHKLKVMIVFDGDNTGREATKKILTQLRDNGVSVSAVHFGGNDGFDLADYCKQHGKDAMSQLQRLAAYSMRATALEQVSSKLNDEMIGILAGDENMIPPGESVLIPFKSFHEYGSYARMTAPGKMGMVMAMSGFGKTSLLETWVDYWLKQGVDVLWHSPEWDALETHFRRIQRNGGATLDQMQDLILYRNEVMRGVSKAQRQGFLLPQELHSKTNQVMDTVSNWPGKLFCYRAQDTIEQVLEAMTERLQLQRRDGRRVGIAVFDYMQLLHTKTEINGKNSYEVLCALIKQWCIDNCCFALVGIQVTKTAGRSDSILGQHDAQWVRSDTFNLIVTLNIEEQEKFIDGVGTGTMEKKTTAIANICKNSTGKTGVVNLKTNFAYLAWEEA